MQEAHVVWKHMVVGLSGGAIEFVSRGLGAYADKYVMLYSYTHRIAGRTL